MSDQHAPEPQSPTTSRHVWIQRAIGSVGMLAVLIVLMLHDAQQFLNDMKTANEGVAAAISHATPERLEAAYAERRASCDYPSWFWCVPKTEPCLKWATGGCVEPVALDVLSAAWQFARDVASLPDVGWYVLETAYDEGVLTFLMTLIFAGINLAVAFFILTRVPLLLVIAAPLSVWISSWIYWVVQRLFLAASDGFGLAIQLTLLIALVPEGIRLAFTWVRWGHEVHGIAHKAGEVGDALRHLK